MNEIRSLLKTAASRLETSALLNRLHWVAIVAAAIALALMIADRLPAQAFVPWVWVAPALAGLAVVIGFVWWRQRRATEQHVAVVVDERLDLREKLSTALCVQGRDDAFAQAAIEDAVNAAKDPRTQELVRRRFKVEPPRLWWISPMLILGALMVSLLDPLNLFARDRVDQQELKQAKLESEKAVDAIVNTIKESPQLEKELSEMLGQMSKEGVDPNAMLTKTPKELKQDALKKATDIQKKLDEILNGEKGKTVEAMEQALSQLQKPEQDENARELADAMANGDFQRAEKAIKDMMAKLEEGKLSPEQKQAAAEALEEIAKQLEDLAKQQQQLQEALKQAGLDPNLANNPQAMQQAIQNAQNLNQQQKQELQQMAQAQQAAAQMCQGMAGACKNMAAAMNGQAKAGQAGQQAGQMLGDMEALKQLLQEAKLAQGQCQGQCQGLGQGLAMKPGGAFGQRGQGRGGKAPIAPTPTGTKETKVDVNTVEGDVIAKTLFEGQQVRGDSKAQIVKVIEEERKGFDEGQQDEATHRKYQEAQQHYFGELEKLTKALQEEAAKTGEAKPAAEGASPADNAGG